MGQQPMIQSTDLRVLAHQRKKAFEAKVRDLAANVYQGNEPRKIASPGPPVKQYDPLIPRWKKIVIEVSVKHQVPIRSLMTPGRDLKTLYARWEMYYRLHTEVRMSMNEIARRTNKDHTTVMHGINKYKQEMNCEPQEDAARQSLLDRGAR